MGAPQASAGAERLRRRRTLRAAGLDQGVGPLQGHPPDDREPVGDAGHLGSHTLVGQRDAHHRTRRIPSSGIIAAGTIVSRAGWFGERSVGQPQGEP